MSDIKKGALVKAWDDDHYDFVVGELFDIDEELYLPYEVADVNYKNAVEIPPELAKQLEELGS